LGFLYATDHGGDIGMIMLPLLFDTSLGSIGIIVASQSLYRQTNHQHMS
jgi:hypothetical protein